MKFEAELLKIIEEQQQQLKQLQTDLYHCLQALGRYGTLIKQLENWIDISEKQHSQIEHTISDYQGTIRKLQEQPISEHLSQSLQDNLKEHLEKHLTELVSSSQIKDQVGLEIQHQLLKQLPQAVENEISKQLHPLISNLQQRQLSLQTLIEQLSERL